MRYLAIDLGEKRTGLAMGTDVTRQAQPLRVVEAGDETERLGAIEQAIGEYAPDALVLGLPLHMDGSEGPMAKQVRRFADQLGARLGLPVHLVDERLSSEAANSAMSQTGLTRGRKKRVRDAVAAATILRDFLERDGGARSE
ncbi:MAG: Holliday junction resolvase RuvX [bacterium]